MQEKGASILMRPLKEFHGYSYFFFALLVFLLAVLVEPKAAFLMPSAL